MNNLRRHRWNGTTAIFAGVMLFFQLALGGFALGTAAAAAPTLDIFGNPLCITGFHASQDENDRDHSALPDCCTPGCSMFAPVKDFHREQSALANPLARSDILPTIAHSGFAIGLDDYDPGSPRAPPIML